MSMRGDLKIAKFKNKEKAWAIIQLSNALLNIYEKSNHNGIYNEEVNTLKDIINTENNT